MAKARTWNLRWNLDEFNVDLLSCRSTQENSDYLLGMQAGGNALDPIDQPSAAWMRGYEFGRRARTATEEHRDRMQKQGRLGGNPNLKVNPRVIREVNRMDNQKDKLSINHNHLSKEQDEGPGHGWDEL